MSFRSVILLLSLFINYSHDSSADSSVLTILENGMAPTALACTSPLEADYKNCLKAICPARQPMEEFSLKATYDRPTEQELTKLVSTLMDKKRLDIEKFRKIVQSPAYFESDTVKLQIEMNANLLFLPFVKPSINMSNPLSKRIEFRLEDLPKDLNQEMMRAAKSWLKSYNEVSLDESTLLALGAYTSEEMKEILKSKKQFLLKEKSLKDHLEKSDQALFNEIFHSPDNPGKDELNKRLQKIHLLTNPSSIGVSSHPLCVGDCYSVVKKKIVFEKRVTMDELTESLNDEKKTYIIQSCLNKIAVTDAYVQKVKKTEEQIPETKKMIVDAIQRMCPMSRDVSDGLSEVKFDFHIKNKTTPIQDIMEALKTKIAQPSDSSDPTLQYNATKDLEDLCQFNGQKLEDSWDVRSHTISVSPMSTQEGSGRGIILHELGHSISSTIANLPVTHPCRISYEKTRSCVTERQRHEVLTSPIPAKTVGYPIPNTSIPFRFTGDSYYSEEDMADHLSAIAKKDDGATRTICGLVEDYDEDEIPSGALSSLDQIHSPGMARAFWEILDKGDLIPNSCQPLLKEMPDFRFERCP